MTSQEHSTHQEIGFLPANQTSSPPTSKIRRAYLSCERCRKRKSRCEPLPGQTRCKRCTTDDQACEFRASRSTKRKSSPLPGNVENETRRIRQESENDRGRATVEQSPGPKENIPHGASRPAGEFERPVTTALDARTRLVSTHIHNAADALDLLTFAASGSQGYNNASSTPANESQMSSALPSTVYGASNARRTNPWNGFVLIRKGVVSQQEVMEYLDFFFDRLWPLKPVVPSYYRNRAVYMQLAVEEPLLVTCLVTLASRYFPLSGSHGEIRSERIHWQTWKFLQRFLQSVMWGSTTTRSLGAISSMLLLIDWHVKAINNPMDFTDGEDEAINFVEDAMAAAGDNDSLIGQRRYGMTSLMEKLNIVSPAYRSNKMSWILLSNAIALAHEGCCFENEGHTPSAPSAEAIRQEWSRLICVFIYLADEGLATRLGLEPLLPEKSRQVVKDRFSTTFADSLSDSTLWEGYFELAVEARKGREFLHSLKKMEASLSDLNLVPNLDHLRRALSRWKRQYQHRHDANTFLSACLDMEFYYITMYCFAPAAQASQSSSRAINDDTALSDFSDQAAQASFSLLSVIVDVLEPAKLLVYLPVRCWLFIVAASLHLLKATLAKDQHIPPSHPNIHLLHSVIDAIRHGSPDDSHMAMRFSKFLGIMLQASLPVSPVIAEGDQVDEVNSAAQEGDGPGPGYASFLEHVDIWDIPLNLDVVGDPLTWWDSFSGRNGFARFP
ncbi:hypothetical protein ACJZ2D_013414 [Fusarium nematophilum]